MPQIIEEKPQTPVSETEQESIIPHKLSAWQKIYMFVKAIADFSIDTSEHPCATKHV